MMTLKQVNASADALAGMYSAGTPIMTALNRMAMLQPSYAEFWQQAKAAVSQGGKLSAQLKLIWPQSLVNAITAGETSGKVEQSLIRIAETTEMQMQMQNDLSKLLAPMFLFIGGIGSFIFYMVFVLPNIGKVLASKSTSSIMQLSAWMTEIYQDYGIIIGISFLIVLAALISWSRTSEARQTVLTACLHIPFLREALRDLYFGIWANYMSLVVGAGLGTVHGLKLTTPILPVEMRTSMHQFIADLEDHNKSLTEAADLKQQHDDRALWWPFYVSQAFLMADSTGRVDEALLKVAPSLIKEGRKRLALATKTAWFIAIVCTAMMAVAPLIAYYIELGTAFRNSGF